MSSDSSSPSDARTSREAFDVGSTTLNIDDISDDELDALDVQDEAADASPLNLQTVSGLILILAGLVYLLTELGVGAPYSPGLEIVFPWLVGTLVLVTGFGGIAWRYIPSVSSSFPFPTSPMRTGNSPPNENDPRALSSPRLARSRTDKKLLGVCGGMANYLDIDPTLVRVAFVIGAIFFGPLLIAYFGFAFAMPKAPPSASRERPPRSRNTPNSN